MAKVTMRQMLDAGVHFGHQTRLWNPKMVPYIYGSRFGVHIINLEKSLPMFNDALKYVHKVAAARGKILFVGTKDVACDILEEQAVRCEMPYVNHRWLGGMLTNYKTIRLSIRRLRDLEKIFEKQRFEGLTKKERLSLSREFDKLKRSLGGIKVMGGLPDMIFVIDVRAEKIAVDEANKLGIPVVGIVDSNNSPDNIDYLVPGNDDSFSAVSFYCERIADTIIEARKHIIETRKIEKEKEKEKGAKIADKKDVKAKRKVVTKAKPVEEKAPAAEKPEAKITKKVEAGAVSAKAPGAAEKKAATETEAKAKKAKAEGEVKAKKATAETEAKAKKAKAEGEAKTKKATAETDAKAKKAKTEAATKAKKAKAEGEAKAKKAAAEKSKAATAKTDK